MYKGIGASAGIGIGKIVKIKEEELNYTKQSIEDTEASALIFSPSILASICSEIAGSWIIMI